MPWRRVTEGTPAAASRRRCTNLPLWKERPATSPSKPSVGYPTFACSPSLNMQYPYTCTAWHHPYLILAEGRPARKTSKEGLQLRNFLGMCQQMLGSD